MSIVSENISLVSNSVFRSCFVCTSAYWSIISMRDTKILRDIAKITSRFATLSLFVLLADRWIEFGYFPLSNLYESLLFLSCLLLFVYQVLEYKIQSPVFGGIILPIVLFITAFPVMSTTCRLTSDLSLRLILTLVKSAVGFGNTLITLFNSVS